MKLFIVPLLIAFSATPVSGEDRKSPAPSVRMEQAKPQFTVTPIGRIERQNERTFVRLEPRYHAGLLGLDQWSHVWVLYWFDRNDTPEKRAVLQVHPRGNRDNPLTGVFATRSPMRPNLIALTLCRVLSVKGTDIEIERIDALDQTPVIDLKPHIRGLDTPQGELEAPDWSDLDPPL